MCRLIIAVAAILSVGPITFTFGQSQVEGLVPEDTCILELQMPAGAQFRFRGQQYPASTVAETRVIPFQPGQTLTYPMEVRFPGGDVSHRTLFLRGGRRVRLPIPTPHLTHPELVVQTGHVACIHSSAISPCGQWMLTASCKGKVFLWNVDSGRQVRSFDVREGACSVAFSSDSRQVLTLSDDGATLWDAENGARLRSLRRQLGDQSAGQFLPDEAFSPSVAISPNGRRILARFHRSEPVVLWDVESGTEIRSFVGIATDWLYFDHIDTLPYVAFRSDGQQVLAASGNNMAIVWDAETGSQVHALRGHEGPVLSVAFSPEGRRAVTGSEDKRVILWDAVNGKLLQTFLGHTGPVIAAAWSSDGRQLLTAEKQKAILWDVKTSARLAEQDVEHVSSVAFGPNGARVVAAPYGNRPILLWNLVSHTPLRTFRRNSGPIESVRYCPDGSQVLTNNYGRANPAVWDLHQGVRIRSYPGRSCISRDGKRVLIGRNGDDLFVPSSTTGSTLVLQDVESGAPLHGLQGYENQFINSVRIGPNNRRALVDVGGVSILWDLDTGKKLHTFKQSIPWEVTFSPDGLRLLCSQDNRTSLWNAENGSQMRSFRGDPLTLSPDGRRLVTRVEGKEAVVWETSTGNRIHSLVGHSEAVTSVEFSPDGRRILTGSIDRTAVVWDATSGERIRTLAGHSAAIGWGTFGPDGHLVVTYSPADGLIFWDADRGAQLRILRMPQSSTAMSLAFNPDGNHVIVGCLDGSARLFDIATGDETAWLINLDSKDWLVVTPEGLFDGTEGGRELVSYRIADGLDVVPVDRFFADFYTPGLLAKIARGERPMPAVELGVALPPKVRINSPKAGGITEDSLVTVEIEAIDLGGGIQGPWLKQNGARLLSASKTEQAGTTVRRTFEVRLVEGENRIEVRAATNNEFATTESEPAVLVLRYEKPLQKPHLYLLAVGSNYKNTNLKLRYAGQDAKALAELFKRRGKALYKEVHVHLLLDDQATKEGVRKILTGEDASFAKVARPQDSLLVYLGGHGAVVGQRYFYIPTSFHRDSDDLETDIKRQGLAADVLGDWMADVPCLKRMLIVDTCASGAALDLVRTTRNPFALRGVIERLNRTQGVFSIAAAAATQEAQEVQELGHGVLTYALLAGLGAVTQGPLEGQRLQSANPDQVATVMEWFGYADSQVPRLMKKYFGQAQDIQFSGQGTSFPVLPVDGE